MEEVAKGALLKALINNIFTIDDSIFSQEEVNSLSKYRNTFVHLSIAPEHYSPEYIETQRLKEDQSINYFQELIYIGAINILGSKIDVITKSLLSTYLSCEYCIFFNRYNRNICNTSACKVHKTKSDRFTLE